MIDYLVHLAIIICINLILALGLQFSIGYSGMLNLAHIAFYGIGAYTSALLVMQGTPFLLAIIIAGLLPGIIGYYFSRPINKLKGDYLALATMGFTFVIYALMLNWQKLTRGPLGIPGIPKPDLLSSNYTYLFFCLVIAALVYVGMRRITASRFGKLLEATRDDELAVQSMGKNTLRMKSISLGLASGIAGIAGALYAHYITYIDPSSFGIMQLIPIIAIVIIGGLASLRGTIIATIILTLLPEPLRFIGFPSSIIGPIRQLIFAVLLIVIMIYRPKGISGKVELES